MKDPENSKQWIIDEEAAQVVRRIFSLCMEGRGPLQIAKVLMADKVLNPTAYRISKRPLKATSSIWCHYNQQNIIKNGLRGSMPAEAVLCPEGIATTQQALPSPLMPQVDQQWFPSGRASMMNLLGFSIWL